jgi:hypothetical protein
MCESAVVISVPAVVRNKARAVGATAWLEDLPSLIAGLERDWSIVVGRAYEDATEAFVSEVTCEDGAPAVLKLCVPRSGDAARNEITVLRLAGGDGCVEFITRTWEELDHPCGEGAPACTGLRGAPHRRPRRRKSRARAR